tara:strand:+ start:264 stop:1061 length:798 start_codon:yes stop_codon:yes gene_type:complete
MAGNREWIARPIRAVGSDLRRGERAGRGSRMRALLEEELEENDVAVRVSNSSGIRAQVGDEEADVIIRRLTTPPTSPRSNLITSTEGSLLIQRRLQSVESSSYNYESEDSSCASSSSASCSSSSTTSVQPAKKRKRTSRVPASNYVPYFKYNGKNSKGIDVYRCLLRPTFNGTKATHSRDVICYSTSNLKQHLTTWHLPALTQIINLNAESSISKSSVAMQIFEQFNEPMNVLSKNQQTRSIFQSAAFASLLGDDNAFIHQQKLR